jgi:hypothetical protein
MKIYFEGNHMPTSFSNTVPELDAIDFNFSLVPSTSQDEKFQESRL